MTKPYITATTSAHATSTPAWLERLGRTAVERSLENITEGRLTLVEGDRRRVFGSPAAALAATVHVRDPAFHAAVALRGSVGAGESYVRGEWSADALPTALRVVLRNRAALESIESGLARLAAVGLRGLHALRANTRAGSRLNIASHYDVGNEFFACFLDETLTYSCGLFESAGSTLLEASVAKLDRACRKLDLRPDDHLLEVGTGWGSLAIHAASRYGCRVTTTTISREQHELATERVRAAGLAGRVEVLLEDYRDLEGTHDKLVSIEMIEAVGHDRLDEYFSACCERLAPDGLMLLQAITIADRHHADQLRAPDFIKRHVFPGSHIPSHATIAGAVARSTDFRAVHLEDLTPHYVRTLAEWRRRLHERRRDVLALGHSEPSFRAWDYYMAYCEAGFAERYLGDVQLLLARPRNRRAPLLPPLRAA